MVDPVGVPVHLDQVGDAVRRGQDVVGATADRQAITGAGTELVDVDVDRAPVGLESVAADGGLEDLEVVALALVAELDRPADAVVDVLAAMGEGVGHFGGSPGSSASPRPFGMAPLTR